MDDCVDLEETLATAKKVLAKLEKKAAGYTVLSIPSDLELELEEKQKEVASLEQRLKEAQSKKEIQAGMSYVSRMRSPVSDKHYIERDEAKRLLERFALALQEPEKQPLLFNLYGIGGVGKTTLLGRLQNTHAGDVDFLEVCFAKTGNIETPLKLMRTLHQQAIKLVGNEQNADSFSQQERLFENALFQLSRHSVDGEAASTEDARKITSWFERFIWLGPTGLISTSNKPKSWERSRSPFSPLTTIGEDPESLQEWIQQRVRNHPATKDQPELQALMLQPVSKLTQAFADSMMQVAQKRGRSLVLVLDTYEKAQSYLNQWLWQNLVEDTTLYSAPVRLVVVGRRSLETDEGWRKLNQDRKLLYGVNLQKFSREDTENYLKQIGIENGGTRAKIYKVTQGLPYYLDWVRKQREEGKELDFYKGNQAIADLLLQGLDSQQQKILQVVACCRRFNLAMIRYLLRNKDLGLQQDADNVENYFQWLKRSDFVEFSKRHYRLDDVARDVFRQSYFQEDRNQFRKTNALLADYFKEQADDLFDPQSPLPDRYEDEEWRELIAEFLYYSFLGKGREGLRQYIEKIFVAVYLREPDVFRAPFTSIIADMSEENQKLLPTATGKFFKDSAIVLTFGWFFLYASPESYKIKFEGGNFPSEKTEAFSKTIEVSLKPLLGYVSDLEDGLGKCVGLIYKSLRCDRYREMADLLLQAKSQTEQLLTHCRPKLLYSLFSYIGHLLLIINEYYQESLDCYERALELGEGNAQIFFGHGVALDHLDRHEEALESCNKAIDLDPEFPHSWGIRGDILNNLKRYEESLESYQKVIECDSKSVNAWMNIGRTLNILERYEEALESYQKAIDLDPGSFKSWANHGISLVELERYKEGLKSYQKAIFLNPGSVDIWVLQGKLLKYLERYEEAIESFQKAIDLDPDFVYAWTVRGYTLRTLKRYKEAIIACDRAVELDPKNSDALNIQALILSLLQEFEKALIAIDKAIALEPQEAVFKANRGIILAREGRYTEAFTDCEQAINQNPKHESGYYAKACCYALQGEIEQAIDNLQKAIDIKPGFSRSEAKHNPDFDSIRDDERFRALVYPTDT